MNMRKMKQIIIVLFLIAVAIGGGVLLSGDGEVVAADGAHGQGAQQAMPVEVAIMKPQAMQIWSNFSGHVVAVDQADIRPQVSGRITEVKFEGGQHVEKDDVLFVIDPRPYEASFSQAKAALSAAQTAASLAEKEYQRAKTLIGSEAISQGLLDERTNNRQTAAAAVQGAKALVEEAQINLDYAHVKAPIAGKASRVEITEGNLVQAGSGAPLLTSIVSDEKVYVDFEVDERSYLELMKDMKSDGDVPVRLILSGGDLEYVGIVQSFDNKIDVASGTVRARAIFDNKDKIMLPGMSVSVEMGRVGDQQRILLTERAIGTDQDRKFVYIVNAEGVTEYREVKIGESIKGQRVILSGLDGGEQVITEGIVRIRPGMPVAPKVKEEKGEIPAMIAPEIDIETTDETPAETPSEEE